MNGGQRDPPNGMEDGKLRVGARHLKTVSICPLAPSASRSRGMKAS